MTFFAVPILSIPVAHRGRYLTVKQFVTDSRGGISDAIYPPGLQELRIEDQLQFAGLVRVLLRTFRWPRREKKKKEKDRLQYMVRCPFSLSRLVKVTDTGQVVYKAEKQACQAFPDPHADDLKAGANRNFQVLSPLDFLAEFTQHIPPKGCHTIRYFGFYSNKSRGMRKKAEVETSAESFSESEENAAAAAATRSSQTWAMLIKRALSTNNPAKWTH